MKRSYKYILNLGLIMLLISVLAACSLASVNPNRNNETPGGSAPEYSSRTPEETGSSPAGNPTETADESASQVPSMPEKPKGSTSIRIRAVGDIMMHSPQIPAGQKEDGTYDFRYFFEEVKPYLEDSDIAIGNFECTIGDGSIGYSGYPLFRSPRELADALKYAGFDILTTANNHSFDGREFGVGYTLDQLDASGILHTGTARSMEERNIILMVEEKDIKVAVLAYTYGTNGMEAAISADKLPYMINYIDRDMISKDIAQAKEEGADLIIAAMHWGNEYQRLPDGNQKDLADFLFNEGVDIILGSHPHVIQPMEKRRIELDDGTQKDVFIIYSLGNFISNQYWQYSDSGVIVDIEVIKNHDTGEVNVGSIGYIPTWVQRVFLSSGRREYRVLPVERFMKDDNLSREHSKRIKEVWNETTEHIGSEGFSTIE